MTAERVGAVEHSYGMGSSLPFLLSSLVLAAAIAGGPAAAKDPLDRLRWQARVLVIAASDPGDARVARQSGLYRDAQRGMRERDLVLVEAVGGGAEASALRRRLGVVDPGFAAILLGKDGGEKLRAATPIPAARLFETVDEMPMRRDEMRRGRNSG